MMAKHVADLWSLEWRPIVFHVSRYIKISVQCILHICIFVYIYNDYT